MTNEEAIMVLGMVEAYGLADEAKQIAIEALKKQIPMKPYRDNIYKCSACNKILGANYECVDYCYKCGQRIDWSKDD